MHARTEEVLTYLDTQRAALDDAVAAVPAALRERRPAPDRWSVAEILDHVAVVEGRIAPLITGRIAAARDEGLGPERETSPVLPTLDVASIVGRSRRIVAGEASQPRAGVTEGEARAALDRQSQAIREAVLSADGLALGEVIAPNPVFGPLNMYQWVLFVAGHEGRHAAQIRELAAELHNGG
jgi:uncharacterized damage-inducible protein DinB